MWLFSLVAVDVRLAGVVCLLLACMFGSIAWLAIRRQWPWIAYGAVVLTSALFAFGFCLLWGGMAQ